MSLLCFGGVRSLCHLPILCDILNLLHMGPTQEPLRAPHKHRLCLSTLWLTVTFHQCLLDQIEAAGKQSDRIKHQNVPRALPAVLLALHYLYHLKNNAKYHKSLKGGHFKILTIWREKASPKMGKPFTERASSQSTHPIPVHLTHSTPLPVHF